MKRACILLPVLVSLGCASYDDPPASPPLLSRVRYGNLAVAAEPIVKPKQESPAPAKPLPVPSLREKSARQPAPAAAESPHQSPPVLRRRPRPLLTTPGRDPIYRHTFPAHTTSETLAALRDDPDTYFYSELDMGRWYQVFENGQLTMIDAKNSGIESANNEFPWRDPAGMLSTSNYAVVRFARLPPGSVEWWRELDGAGRMTRIRWAFMGSRGALLGENIQVVDGIGNRWTFETRTRRKLDDNEGGAWSMQAYNPVPTEQDYVRLMRKRGIEPVLGNAPLLTVDSRAIGDGRFERGHVRNAFADSGRTTTLASLSDLRLIADILETEPFQPRKGLAWRTYESGDSVTAPTASDFNLVPRDYVGFAIPVSNESCMRCHESAGKTVNIAGRRRWGLRGDDGAFSFHPFDPDSNQIKLNPRLVAAGVLVHRFNMP